MASSLCGLTTAVATELDRVRTTPGAVIRLACDRLALKMTVECRADGMALQDVAFDLPSAMPRYVLMHPPQHQDDKPTEATRLVLVHYNPASTSAQYLMMYSSAKALLIKSLRPAVCKYVQVKSAAEMTDRIVSQAMQPSPAPVQPAAVAADVAAAPARSPVRSASSDVPTVTVTVPRVTDGALMTKTALQKPRSFPSPVRASLDDVAESLSAVALSPSRETLASRIAAGSADVSRVPGQGAGLPAAASANASAVLSPLLQPR